MQRSQNTSRGKNKNVIIYLVLFACFRQKYYLKIRGSTKIKAQNEQDMYSCTVRDK